MSRAYLDLGSNVDREHSIKQALTLLTTAGEVSAVSSVYASSAWGPPGQPEFHNVAVALETTLAPGALREALRDIERSIGRVRTPDRFAPRCIDIDVILYDDVVMTGEGWALPHPQLQDRPFVLVPLVDIAGDVVHPVRQCTLRAMLAEHPEFLSQVERQGDNHVS